MTKRYETDLSKIIDPGLDRQKLKIIGSILERQRKQIGLSKEFVARSLGVHKKTYHKIEMGTKELLLSQLFELHRLGFDIKNLMGWADTDDRYGDVTSTIELSALSIGNYQRLAKETTAIVTTTIERLNISPCNYKFLLQQLFIFSNKLGAK